MIIDFIQLASAIYIIVLFASAFVYAAYVAVTGGRSAEYNLGPLPSLLFFIAAAVCAVTVIA